MSQKLQAVVAERHEYPIDLREFPWYKWFPAKFNLSEDAAPLNLTDEGALRRLLDHQWINGSIPTEIEKLAAICKRVAHSEMETIWNRLKSFFEPHPRDPTRVINPDLWEQMKDVSRASERQARFGRIGARKRWGTHGDPIGEPIPGAIGVDGRKELDKETATVGDYFERTPTRGQAMIVLAKLRESRVLISPPQGSSRYVIAPESLDAVEARARRAVAGIGGLHVIANTPDDKLAILRAQFAEIFVSSSAYADEKVRIDR
jgi:hypothetical protein